MSGPALRVAAPDQHWFAGGIIQRIEWTAGSCDVRLWGGDVRRVDDGDTVLVFYRGLRSVAIVGVEARTQEA